MLERLFNNIFASSHQGEITAGRFNHCSTVCGHKNGALIAWYAGVGECQDNQSVHITYYQDGSYSEVVRIGDKTGNPVLWTHQDNAYLLWSKFEDSGKLKSIVDRWKFCSLWIQQIGVKDGIEFFGDPIQLAHPDKHLLGRCHPITITNNAYRGQTAASYLLPLYDELNRNGVAYHIQYRPSNIILTSRLGNIGHDMIQPTIWANGDRIHSLSRNFSPGRENLTARYCYSDDNGLTWSESKPTEIPNNNSSLCVLPWNGYNIILWNDTQTIKRRNLMLGTLAMHDLAPVVMPIAKMGDIGGYPSMCVDAVDRLHITFSNSARTIEHHVWNKQRFYKAIKSSARAGRGRDSS